MVKDSSLMIQLSKKASELMFYEWKYLIENSWLMYIHSSEWWGFAKQRSYNHSAVQIKTVKEKFSRNTEFLLFFIFWVGHYWPNTILIILDIFFNFIFFDQSWKCNIRFTKLLYLHIYMISVNCCGDDEKHLETTCK